MMRRDQPLPAPAGIRLIGFAIVWPVLYVWYWLMD